MTAHTPAAQLQSVDEVYSSLLLRVGESAPQPRLAPTARALSLLGDPHRDFPIIHITGTNGKTSTSRMIDSILREQGARVGLFTSPHIVTFTERIVIDGRPADDERVLRAWPPVRAALGIVDGELAEIGDQPITYFEALTVLAFAIFGNAGIDVGVIEVGIGGEWDSTNVADARVAVLLPVSLDHTKQLGPTVRDIARVKSGIIKSRSTVVSAVQPAEALAEIVQAASRRGSTLHVESKAFAVLDHRPCPGGQFVTVRGPSGVVYPDLFLALSGVHQAHNAAVAIAAVEVFDVVRMPIPLAALRRALAGVTSPGRLELVAEQPPLLLDAAHNPAGAESLSAALDDYYAFREIWFVVGALQGKDAAGVIAAIARHATLISAVQSTSERAVDARDLARIVDVSAPEVSNVPTTSLADALRQARAWAAERVGRAVVVTGSITLLGEAASAARDLGWATGV